MEKQKVKVEEPEEEEGKTSRYHCGTFSVFHLSHDRLMTLFLPVNDALAFDGVDFDEPMEVEVEEEKPAVKDEAEPKAVEAKVTVKVEPKSEPQDPVLL